MENNWEIYGRAIDLLKKMIKRKSKEKKITLYGDVKDYIETQENSNETIRLLSPILVRGIEKTVESSPKEDPIRKVYLICKKYYRTLGEDGLKNVRKHFEKIETEERKIYQSIKDLIFME